MSCTVAVIVVNYGTPELALKAAQSVIDAEHGPCSVHIHIVDNASPGGDAAELRAEIFRRGWSDRVTLHAEAVNHGFGRGNNIVLDALTRDPEAADFAFLLNPDAQLENDAVRVLAAHLMAHPQAGAAGARIEDSHGAPVTAAFRFPSVASEFEGAAAFGPASRLLASHRVPLPPAMTLAKVDWVAGAAVMLRIAALRDAGTFNPGYFLYYEETDLMRALARKGWDTWYVPAARVSHLEGAATGIRSAEVARRRRPSYLYQSWRMYFTANHGRAYAVCAAMAWLAGAGLNHVVSGLRRRPAASPLALVPDVWANVLRPLLRGAQT